MIFKVAIARETLFAPGPAWNFDLGLPALTIVQILEREEMTFNVGSPRILRYVKHVSIEKHCCGTALALESLIRMKRWKRYVRYAP